MTVTAGIVCGNCDRLNPVDRSTCDDCENELTLVKAGPEPTPETEEAPAEPTKSDAENEESPPTAAQQGAEEKPMEQARHYTCKSCYSPVPSGHKFCGKCGTSVGEEAAQGDPNFFGDMQTPGKAKLILIKGEGMDGISYHLNSTEHMAGRAEGEILFTEDKWLSPKHANFVYDDDGKLKVKDESSENGVFIALRGSTSVEVATVFMAGEQVFRVEEISPFDDEPESDGTYFFASPRTDSAFRVVQILEGGGDGMTVCARENEIVIGREGCDMNFPNDPYISGNHVKVSFAAGGLTLTDLDSKNGTYLKIDGERELVHGDYIFLGRQLLRVEITP